MNIRKVNNFHVNDTFKVMAIGEALPDKAASKLVGMTIRISKFQTRRLVTLKNMDAKSDKPGIIETSMNQLKKLIVTRTGRYAATKRDTTGG